MAMDNSDTNISLNVLKSEDEEDEPPRRDIDPKLTTSHGYFHGHACQLKAKDLSTYDLSMGPISKRIFNFITVRSNDVRALTLYKSYAALCAEKYRHFKHYPCMIHPYSSLRLFLDILNVIMLLLLALYLAFYYGVINTRVLNFHTEIIYFCDCIFILNIFANFFTGYIEGHSCKEVVFDMKKIAWNYTKTWLLVDIISSISFIPYFFHQPYSPTCFILESVKLLRVPCATQYLRNILIVMKASLHQTIAVEILLCIITFLSWNIYFQFSVEYMIEGSFQPVSPRLCSWLTYGKLWNETMSVRMVYALDRAGVIGSNHEIIEDLFMLPTPENLVGMLTSNTNMNIIQRQHCFEVFFAVAWLISKFFVFHFVMKYLMALLGTEAARAKYYIMQKQLRHYMIERKFSPRLKKKILKFYSIRFQSKYFTESAMVDCVSGQLREDILMHTGRQLVKELDFLKQLPMPILMQIAFKLRVVIFIAGDIIIKINTIGDCLYFIDKGTVAIYSESGQEICHLEDGDFFGGIALVMGRFRSASAVAVTNCELFRLDKEDFDSTIAFYPIVYDNIKKVARDRFETTCVLDEHHKAELKTDDGSDMRA